MEAEQEGDGAEEEELRGGGGEGELPAGCCRTCGADVERVSE